MLALYIQDVAVTPHRASRRNSRLLNKALPKQAAGRMVEGTRGEPVDGTRKDQVESFSMHKATT